MNGSFLFILCLFNMVNINLSYELNYDVVLSQRYVEFSGIAYCADPIVTSNSVDQWNCKFCKNYPNVNATSFYGGAVTDAKGYVAYDADADEIIVSFSGTDPISLRNWIDDINMIQVDYPYCAETNCQVHQGFYNTFLSVKDQVVSLVASFKAEHSSANIAVTGHSLGASLAVLGMAELTHLGYDVDASYNYGQPRTGDEAFEIWYKETVTGTYRVTHHKDPVPHMVPTATGFHHMPYEIFYNQNDFENPIICNFEGEDDSCSNQYAVDANIPDHLHYMGFDFTTNYLSAGCEF